jgi:hypothetical protein
VSLLSKLRELKTRHMNEVEADIKARIPKAKEIISHSICEAVARGHNKCEIDVAGVTANVLTRVIVWSLTEWANENRLSLKFTPRGNGNGGITTVVWLEMFE